MLVLRGSRRVQSPSLLVLFGCPRLVLSHMHMSRPPETRQSRTRVHSRPVLRGPCRVQSPGTDAPRVCTVPSRQDQRPPTAPHCNQQPSP
eukprot:1160772-Rhodomonas_salina.1